MCESALHDIIFKSFHISFMLHIFYSLYVPCSRSLTGGKKKFKNIQFKVQYLEAKFRLHFNKRKNTTKAVSMPMIEKDAQWYMECV